jgi:hypothetical protein
VSPRPDSSERFDDLESIEASLAASNQDLYRHLALYLQVLRQVLPGRVEQACFHLATQVHPQRYAALPLVQRQALHERLDQLIGRCSSLLTVEQLVGLAGRMALEESRRERQEQRRLLERLRDGRGPVGAAVLADLLRNTGHGDSGTDSASDSGEAGEATAATSLPDGSVQLGLTPPLGLGGFGSLGRIGGRHGDVDPELDPEFAPEFDQEPDQDGDPDIDGDISSDGADDRDPALLLPLAIFPQPGVGPGDDPAPAVSSSPWEDSRLPRDPLLLLRWLEGLEQALVRRLRNLSHAINVELLRAGLSRGLLPVSLLDAVIAGQVETMGAPANLLRLQVPFGPRPETGRLQVMAVLMRPVDLELEEPRLRTCRRRLQQHRQGVRRMAQQFRRLQRRLQAREAERLWRQDIQKSRSGPY